MSDFGKLHAARMDPTKERYHNELYARQLAMAKAIFDYFKRPEAPEEKLDDVIAGCHNLKETLAYKELDVPGYVTVSSIEKRLRNNIIRSMIKDAFLSYLIAKDRKEAGEL